VISEPVRRQLEGDVEILEAALARYRELHSRLASPFWRSHLRRLRKLAGALLYAEPNVGAALRRAE